MRPRATWSVTAGANRPVNARNRSGCCHGGSASSTWWPSDSSRAPASATACARAGSIGTSIGGVVVSAMRRPEGSRPALAANGSAGGGAHEESPSVGPASRSSSAAVSATVRVSTPSVDEEALAASGPREMRPRRA